MAQDELRNGQYEALQCLMVDMDSLASLVAACYAVQAPYQMVFTFAPR